MKVFSDYSLLAHNTFGLDGRCRRFVEYDTVDDALQLARELADTTEPLLILGGGSNLLLTSDFPGTVVHSAIRGVDIVEEDDADVLVRVGSGEVWDDFVALCVERGWCGAENLSLIPGEVGASAVQNIGAYGAEVSSIIYKVEAVDLRNGQLCEIPAADCAYGYRMSRFKREWKNRFLITHVVYRLKKHFEPRLDYGNIKAELERRGITTPTMQELRQVIISIRQDRLPDYHVEGNAGSFFVNPVVSREQYETLLRQYPEMPHYHVDSDHEKIPAGWLIEQCGWKGQTLGRAGVHHRQALVLVNRGGATGAEILTLCDRIREDVKQRFGIDIHPEVNVV